MPEGENLKSLGSKSTDYKLDEPNPDLLETFENRSPDTDYLVEFETNEFTSLCPKTGQPDFGKIRIAYRPKTLCIESKSLKLYLFSYRNHGAFMETLTNQILKDLQKCCDSQWMQVTGNFASRGGIAIEVIASTLLTSLALEEDDA